MTEAAAIIRRHLGTTPPPTVAIVLGTGLGDLADVVEGPISLSYADLPGFPQPGVGGHGGRLVLGQLGKTRVAVLQGRAHFYESGTADVMAPVIDTVKAIGCTTLILTNAAGSLRAEYGPGSAVLINDHISALGVSPLIGRSGDDRFVGMTDAYDPALRARFAAAANHLGLSLPEGVYIWFTGPQFETPAEIRFARLLGADVVGMSTVPEVILARHAGLKVAALSNITNLAAGMADESLSHAHTLAHAPDGARAIGQLITTVLEEGL